MKEFIFNRKNYKSYKDFYTQIYRDLDGKNTIDWEDCKDLFFSSDSLDEFLWYNHDKNIKFTFVNFDKEIIKLQKKFDDFKYNIVIEIFEDFVKEYPNNQLEFIMEDE